MVGNSKSNQKHYNKDVQKVKNSSHSGSIISDFKNKFSNIFRHIIQLKSFLIRTLLHKH